MKAIWHTKYGTADELQLRDIEKPLPKNNEVLIKIHATTVTTTDCNVRNLTFVPKWIKLPVRFKFGYLKPKINILGIEFAGEVEALGKKVERFNIGDRVFGTPDFNFGGHAEYICMPENGILTSMPEKSTWEEVASLSLAANTALYFLRDLGNILKGQKVLINGASSAIGTYAVQLAKFFGSEVTGVCSTSNLKLVKSIGSDHIIDYTIKDFTSHKTKYDIIFDVVSKSSFSRCGKILKKDGIYLATLPTPGVLYQMIRTSIFGSKKVIMKDAVANINNLNFLRQLLEAGHIKPIIDRIYPLDQIVDAFIYVENAHKKGNVVITV